MPLPTTTNVSQVGRYITHSKFVDTFRMELTYTATDFIVTSNSLKKIPGLFIKNIFVILYYLGI